MPRNGTGSYALPNPDVVTGTPVSSTDENATRADIAAALTDSLARDGQGGMTGNLPMGGNRITGLANSAAATDAVTQQQVVLLTGANAMTGNLTIDKAAPTIFLDKSASGQSSRVEGQMDGDGRWFIDLGSNDAESGGNTGSGFVLGRYADDGSFLDAVLTIARATGAPTFAAADLWRTGLSAPARPTGSSGVGQWAVLNPGIGNAVALPSGGAWAWFFFVFDGTTGAINIPDPVRAGVNNGGTTLQAGAAGFFYAGVAWRIT
jgi:hypothetical protein